MKQYMCVCCRDSGCVSLGFGVGSVEVRLLLRNALLEKEKEKFPFQASSQQEHDH